MTTVESGVAIRQPYPKHEARSIAIHEAGHAVCSHLYSENLLSTRLSIRKRGNSGGHHAAMADRGALRRLALGGVRRSDLHLGAMAAEYVFYGQNTTGVGGDVHWHGRRGADGRPPRDGADPRRPDRPLRDPEERARGGAAPEERFAEIGNQIMHRSGGGLLDADRCAGAADRGKRASSPALLGQAFVVAYCSSANKAAIEKVADRLVEAGELYGDEVVELLDSAAGASPRSTCSTRPRGRDLIPPPSPAGRPKTASSEETAERDRGRGSGRAARSSGAARRSSHRRASPPGSPCRPARSPFRSRFGFLVGALIGVVLAISALGVLLALVASERGGRGWS